MKKAACALAVLLCLCVGSQATAAWIDETVSGTGDQGTFASLALDSNDIPHVAWYDGSNARLKYAYRDFDGWHETVIDSGNVGHYTSIAINPVTNDPAIAYFEQDDEYPKYAWYDGTWHTERITWGNDDDYEGAYTTLAFTSTGVPYVAYHYNNGAFRTVGVNVVWKSGSTWNGHRLDYFTFGFGAIGIDNAIAIDSTDYPNIAYHDNTIGAQNQKFGWLDGSGWHTEAAITLDVSGDHADITLDSGDNVFIVYWDYDSGLINPSDCASLLYKGATGWSGKDEIECGDRGYGTYPSVALDSTERVHAVYRGDGDLRYAVEAGSAWARATLVGSGVAGDNGYTGLALDANDHPMVLYYYSQLKDLKFIWDMPVPEVDSITPDSGVNVGSINGAVIEGEYFSTYPTTSTVDLYNPALKATIPGTSVNVASSNRITADFNITGAAIGLYDVRVTNAAGTGSLADGFEVTAPKPVLQSINPTSGENDDTAFVMTLTGQYLTSQLSVLLHKSGQSDRVASSVNYISPTSATATFSLYNLSTGIYDVVIGTEFGTDTLEGSFTVTCGDPLADFSGSPRFGQPTLSVQFLDESTTFNTCEYTFIEWDFGDGGTSNSLNPTHDYESEGLFTVELSITTDGGADTETKYGYIVTVCNGCVIDGECLADGTVNPDNSCLKCDEAGSSNDWSYNNGVSCEDGTECTSGDYCLLGSCLGTQIDCNDDNPCTDDSCNPATGCVYDYNTDPCDDESACTDSDTCVHGVCRGNTVNCNDDNPCTDDSCDIATGCEYDNNTDSCDDQSACTSGDVCSGGACAGATINCDDNEFCTDDSCNPATGCVYDNIVSLCDDGNKCTAYDECDDGSCVGQTITCNDENPCTDDTCDPDVGCQFTPNTDSCDDTDACTENDACADGACTGETVDCDDSNPCTDDSCNISTGCVYLNNQDPCNDGFFCNGSDYCFAGECDQHDGNPCPIDDGIYCNGIETDQCSEDLDKCVQTGNPCDLTTEECNEETTNCDPLTDDDDDDDAVDDDDDTGVGVTGDDDDSSSSGCCG
jgi:PKD repeat protein